MRWLVPQRIQQLTYLQRSYMDVICHWFDKICLNFGNKSTHEVEEWHLLFSKFNSTKKNWLIRLIEMYMHDTLLARSPRSLSCVYNTRLQRWNRVAHGMTSYWYWWMEMHVIISKTVSLKNWLHCMNKEFVVGQQEMYFV